MSLFFFALLLFLDRRVTEVEAEVESYHREIEHVEEKHVPLLREGRHIYGVDELRGNSADVSEDYQEQKGKAFSLGASHLDGFYYVERPGRAERDQHNDFE